MGNYTVIADVGQAMVSLLRVHLVPEVIFKAELISLCSPKEFGEYRLGIYLYDVQECDGIRNATRQWNGEEIQMNPPMYLNLYYMIVPYSHSDGIYRSVEEQRVMGRTLQVLRDFPLMNSITYEAEEKNDSHTIQIEIMDISFEEKLKIWNGLQEGCRNAVFCKVAAVELESTRSRSVKRVREIQMQFGTGGSIYG